MCKVLLAKLRNVCIFHVLNIMLIFSLNMIESIGSFKDYLYTPFHDNVEDR
jgi:hypothetical protein